MNLQTEGISNYDWMASYLINNDATGMSEAQKQQANKFIEDVKEIYGQEALIVDCDGESHFGLPDWGGGPGSLVNYVIEYDYNKLPSEHWDLESGIPEASRYCSSF